MHTIVGHTNFDEKFNAGVKINFEHINWIRFLKQKIFINFFNSKFGIFLQIDSKGVIIFKQQSLKFYQDTKWICVFVFYF